MMSKKGPNYRGPSLPQLPRSQSLGALRSHSKDSCDRAVRSQEAVRSPLAGALLPPCEKRRPRDNVPAPWQKAAPAPGACKGGGLPRIPSRPTGLASTDPGPEDAKANKSQARHGSEILRIGEWSVRRSSEKDPNASPIYVHLRTGQVQTEPPQEVLNELANDADINSYLPEEQAAAPVARNGGGVPRIPSRPSSARSGAASSDPGRPEDAKANKSRSASPATAAPSREVACHEAEIDLGPEDRSASLAAATPVGEVARHGETSINSN